MQSSVINTPLLRNNELKEPLSHYLRHVLNVNCLVEVFQYLEFCDLLTVCDLDTENDPFFTTLIKDHVICVKYIDFEVRHTQESVWSLSRIFEVFGSSMKIINIPLHKNRLNKIMQAIVSHCTPGAITEIRMIIKGFIFSADYFEPLDPNLLQQIIPYICNLNTLSINGMIFWDIFKHFFVILLNESKNLQTLNFMNFTMEQFIDMITIDKLMVRNLRLYNIGIDRNDLIQFIQKLPRLEVLNCNLQCFIDSIGNTVAKYCPNLHAYGIMSINIENINYNFLAKFDHLTQITLTLDSATDQNLERILQILARRNILRKLIISYYREYLKAIQFKNKLIHFPNGFSSLTDIEFHIQSREDIHRNGKFFQNFLTPFNGLRKITLVSDKIKNVHEIFRYAPRIEVLNICHAQLFQMPKEINGIDIAVKKITHQRNEMERRKPIRLILNSQQAEAYKALKNGQNINICINKHIENYFDKLYNLF